MYRPLRVYMFFVIILMGLFIPLKAHSYTLTGGVHDRSSDPAYIGSGIPGICAECHIPHGAYEIRIWGRDLASAGDADDLCIDCHDGAAPAWASSAQDVSRLKLSYHDFSGNTSIAPTGSCSACHNLHVPSDNTASYVGTYFTSAILWTRDLSGELGEFSTKRDLGSNTPPNYLISATVLCYDCHAGDPANNGPQATDYGTDPLPQDIAFGGDGSDGDGRGGGEAPGYYELTDGSEPDSGSAPTLAEVQAGAVPGGHFVKTPMGSSGVTQNYNVNDPDGNLLYEISVGDKLPCDLCHDPHAGYDSSGDAGTGEDEVFFRRKIYAGEDTLLDRNAESDFDDLRASPASRNWSGGTGRYMCIYCHGTADWPTTGISPLLTDSGTTKRSVFGIKTMAGNIDTTNSSRAFPPPLGPPEHESTDTTTPCTNCHAHNNINASCGGCHDFPPTTGAHLAHSSTASGKPEFNCETCHGPNPGSASWHNESGASAYDPDTHFNNITLKPDLSEAQMGASEYAYYNTTWTRSSSAYAPTVTKASGYQFVCTNVYCHGMDPVNWTWQVTAGPTGPPAPLGEYRLCGGCHGATSDIDGDGNLDPDHNSDGVVDVSSFRDRSGTLYEATSTAANYEIPLSGFSRGGHGDSRIVTWGGDTAPGMTTPVACTSCHDATLPHFNLNNSDPYRLVAVSNDPGGYGESYITNLCLNCHPADGAEYAFLAYPKHSNDHYRNRSTGVEVGAVAVPGTPSVYSTHDPVLISPAVGLHIDRYVDHWAVWGPANPATSDNNDDEPFLPLGDSMAKDLTSDNTYDNTNTEVVTCITCHNPHGTDLFVFGQTPGSGSTLTGIPANKMLRLRDQDMELCDACHN